MMRDPFDPRELDELDSALDALATGRDSAAVRCPLRYIWPAELDLMAQLAGFELESRHADWSGSGFTDESSSHVSVYRIPPGQ